MIRTVKICDRCGKPLETFRMDLCDECLESFDNWFGKYNKTLLFDDFEEYDNTDE